MACITTFAVLMTPMAGSLVLADEDEYRVEVTPVTVTAGEETTFYASFFKNDEEFDPSSDGLKISWWSESLVTGGSSPEGTSSAFTYTEAGTYEGDLKVELWDPEDSWAWVAGAYETVTVVEPEEDEDPVVNEEPEVLEDGITVSIDSNEVHPGDTVPITASVVMDGQELTEIPDGYFLWFWADIWAEGHEDGLNDASALSNSGKTLSDSITFNSEGTYYIAAELKDSSNNRIDITYITVSVSEEQAPSLEEGLNVSVDLPEVHTSDTVTVTAEYVVDGQVQSELPEGYELWFWADIWSSGHEDGSTDITVGTNSGTTLTDTITFNSAGMYYIACELKNGSESVQTVFLTFNITDRLAPVEGDLNFDGVSTLPDDFYMGVDISSVVSELNAGVVYYDYEGNALTTADQFISFLASQGVNSVRVRVWNNPYDSNGNGYGGGNNDVATARIIADACEAAGISMLVDFHLSDFWCDPGKQYAPVAWSSMSVDEKASAVASFITDSLNAIDPNRNTVAMVQVGNETNGAVCGVSGDSDMCIIFDAGCDAVHAWDSSVLAVIHFTNPNNGYIGSWAAKLSNAGVSADVLATSYYPYWHGSLENLTSQLITARSYGFDVMVAETSYAYTLNDSDGHDNTVRSGHNDTGSDLLQPFTVQGQARAVRDVVNAVNNAGGIGMFYWEPAWITVGDTTGLEGDELASRIADNSSLWEQYGCGWAASYAAVYDPDDAGRWYGGSAVDNEALFYADGTPTAAWGVYENIRSGEYSGDITAEAVESFSVTITAGQEYELPSSALVTYSNGSTSEEPVIWDQEAVNAIDGAVGTYVVTGTCAELETSYTLVILPVNLIDEDIAGFETDDPSSAYTVEGNGISAHDTHDVRNGSYGAHWWASEAVEGTIVLNDTYVLDTAGTYTFTCYAEGDSDKGSFVTLMITDAGTDEVLAQSDAVQTDGWMNWVCPEATLTVDEPVEVRLVIGISYAANGWGSIDDLMLWLDEAAAAPEEQEEEPAEPSVVTPIPVVTEAPAVEPSSDQVTQVTEQAASSATTVPVTSDNESYDIDSVVTRLYRILLDRDPDETGKSYWIGRFESGEITMIELVDGIVRSPEYAAGSRNDAEIINDLYEALLSREADETGLNHWLTFAGNEDFTVKVITGIICSSEYSKIRERSEN